VDPGHGVILPDPNFATSAGRSPTEVQRHDLVAEVELRQLELKVSLLKIYNYYRVFVGLALLGAFLQTAVETRIGRLFPAEFLWLAATYTLINLVSALTTHALPRRMFRGQTIPTLFALFDFAVLALLMYFSGGVGSGMGLIMLVSVAAGAVLVTGRASTLLAAVASILVLLEEFVLSFTRPDLFTDYVQGGMLGMLFFAVSLAIRSLSGRLWRSELTALTRAAELGDLERANRSIVARMRTGIMVVDWNDRIRLINQSARSLLGTADDAETVPTALPDAIGSRLAAWRVDTSTRSGPFQVSQTTPEIRTNFSAVRPGESEGDVIVFLDDTTDIQQQAQQLKLAALGRLSGTIAHEIRNPLGAISHAAQLLAESRRLDVGDKRLTDIINAHCRRVNGVIENVLELSRRRPPVPLRLNLASWLHEFEQQFRESAPEGAKIAIVVDPPTTEVRVDPTQLSQALTNLVQNGLRYSLAESGRAIVHLEGGLDGRTDRPYLNVIDFGPGVSDDLVTNLFEPFFTTEQAGTGLGLYITREICEANQARITYARHPGGGSCFRISFAHPDRITA
jgi:two-component system, NtrC family, sensor histidine kinase PilS